MAALDGEEGRVISFHPTRSSPRKPERATGMFVDPVDWFPWFDSGWHEISFKGPPPEPFVEFDFERQQPEPVLASTLVDLFEHSYTNEDEGRLELAFPRREGITVTWPHWDKGKVRKAFTQQIIERFDSEKQFVLEFPRWAKPQEEEQALIEEWEEKLREALRTEPKPEPIVDTERSVSVSGRYLAGVVAFKYPGIAGTRGIRRRDLEAKRLRARTYAAKLKAVVALKGYAESAPMWGVKSSALKEIKAEVLEILTEPSVRWIGDEEFEKDRLHAVCFFLDMLPAAEGHDDALDAEIEDQLQRDNL